MGLRADSGLPAVACIPGYILGLRPTTDEHVPGRHLDAARRGRHTSGVVGVSVPIRDVETLDDLEQVTAAPPARQAVRPALLRCHDGRRLRPPRDRRPRPRDAPGRRAMGGVRQVVT